MVGSKLHPNATYTSWTLKLRPGIKWSDGSSFTAADVVYTVNLIKAGKLQAALNVSDVTVKENNPLTATFTVTKSSPLLALQLFSTVLASETLYVLPEHIWASQKDPATFGNFNLAKGWPVGTGPYKLTAVTPNTFTYTRLDNWWGVAAKFKSLPAPEWLEWTALGTESTRAAAMLDGSMDVGAQFDTGTYLSLAPGTSAIRAWTPNPPYGQPDVCENSLDFNTTVAPWNDPNMRWAVDYAINRQKLASVAFEGASSPMLTPFPVFPAMNKIVAGLTGAAKAGFNQIGMFNLKKSKSLLEAAGYKLNSSGIFEKNGQQLTLQINNFDAAPKNAITAALVEQLREAGIAATQDKQTVPNFITSELSGKFQANEFFGSCGSSTNPYQSLNDFNVSSLVPAGKDTSGFYANPFRWGTANAKKFSALVNQLGQVPPQDASRIETLTSAALAYWYQDLPMIPLLENYEINPVSTQHWKNWPSGADDYTWGLYVSAVGPDSPAHDQALQLTRAGVALVGGHRSTHQCRNGR